jgi:serine/threonine-protein kinase
MSSARICQQCGHSLTTSDRFCPQCGTGQIPVPAPAAPMAGPWEGILDRLARATAPRYRVLRLLGHGGMAGVYLAEEPRLGRRVALKVMAPGLMTDPALVSRFEQEARTTAQLSHPNIVTIYDVDTRDDLHFFVMAFVAGRTLGQITQQNTEPLPARAVLHWFAQAGGALTYAHRMAIVHRDIKPGNIMVDGFGNALVTDFGIAKVADEPSLTRTGFLVGTPTYMSPEQCASAAVTGASDQYSLGVVLYELLTGQPPFAGPTIAVLQAHVTQKPRPVAELRPDCPPLLAAAIDRMLLKAPAERFPTVAAAVSAAGATLLGDDDPLRDRLGAIAAVADAVELPPVGTLAPGEATALGAKVLDASGRPLPNRQIRWVSDTPALLSVNEEGVVYALAPGTGRVTAWCDGVAATALLEITPAPGPLTMLGDPDSAGAAVAATELFTPTPLPAPPPAAPTPPHITAEAVAAPEPAPPEAPPATGPHVPVPSATDAETAPMAPAPASRPDAAPVVVPRAPERATPARGRRRVPVAAAATGAVLVLGLTAAALLGLFDGRSGDASTAGPPESDAPADRGGTAALPPPIVVPAVDSGAVERDTAAADPTEGRAATPTPARPPAAEAPRTGTLRIAGTLPAGARVLLTARGARDGMEVTDGVTLPSGSYTVQVSAPGYQPFSRAVTIRAGETTSLSPDLRAVAVQTPPTPRDSPVVAAPPPPAPPPAAARDAAAAAEEVRGVIGGFVRALASRDLEAVSRQYPGAGGAWRTTWSPLIENTRNVRDLVPQLGAIRDVEVAGDAATAVFTLVLQYDDMVRGRQQPAFDFAATLRRGDSGWILSELRQVQR